MSTVNFDFLLKFIALLSLVEDAQKKTPFPCPCSYRTALTYYLDITSVLNTQVLKEIAQYATNEDEKAILTLMGSYSEEGKVCHNSFPIHFSKLLSHIDQVQRVGTG